MKPQPIYQFEDWNIDRDSNLIKIIDALAKLEDHQFDISKQILMLQDQQRELWEYVTSTSCAKGAHVVPDPNEKVDIYAPGGVCAKSAQTECEHEWEDVGLGKGMVGINPEDHLCYMCRKCSAMQERNCTSLGYLNGFVQRMNMKDYTRLFTKVMPPNCLKGDL